MAMAELNDKFEFRQDGKTYSLYDLPDGFVIKGDLHLEKKGLTELPDLSQVTIDGNFWCNDNQLTSLEGAPRVIKGIFDCNHNNLTSLEGAPQIVGGGFCCGFNQLTSLQGITPKISGDIFCDVKAVEKYGFLRGYLEPKELYDNQIFQQEPVKKKCREMITKILKRKEREAKDAEWHKKHKAGYAAFKKKFKPGGRED